MGSRDGFLLCLAELVQNAKRLAHGRLRKTGTNPRWSILIFRIDSYETCIR